MKVWPVLGIVLMQVILCLAHWFLYVTAVAFWPLGAAAKSELALALTLLSFSFVAAALAGYRFSNILVEVFYTAASIWIGMLNFLFWAACLCWLAALPVHLFAHSIEPLARLWIANGLLALVLLASFYGILNARRIRERRLTIQLPNLPPSWRGRRALFLSDLHLGHVNRERFARRIAGIASRLNPEVIFIAGDFYDGSKADPALLAAPVSTLQPPLGIYFCGGNHEEFGDEDAYLSALRAGGIHVLHNELTEVDGVQVGGVCYSDSTHLLRMRAILEKMRVERNRASILLNHVPNRLPLVEQAGFNLQLSGHTHGGQIFPFTWFTRRAFGKFTRGLHDFGSLQVLTSTGVGTWGPPMRLGTAPEVILITFE